MTLLAHLRRLEFWTAITWLILMVLGFLLILPILRVLMLGFVDAETGGLTLGNFIEVFTRNYYLNGLKNSLFVALLGTLGACLIGLGSGVDFDACYFGSCCTAIYRSLCLDHDVGVERIYYQFLCHIRFKYTDNLWSAWNCLGFYA